LVYPYGAPQQTAVLKSTAADFEVEEILGFEPGGEGEHLFLWVEKCGLGTNELITRMAKDHDLPPNAFGYSGLKAKHALTRQWLSLHLTRTTGCNPATNRQCQDAGIRQLFRPSTFWTQTG